MRPIQLPFALPLLALCVLFLYQTKARAQGAVSYHFLEVVETEGKPVAGAKVETLGYQAATTLQTDENGTVREVPVYGGDINTLGLKVSKPGFITYEDEFVFTDFNRLGFKPGDEFLRVGGQIGGPIKIRVTLLRIPTTPAERKAVEAEQRKRELVVAAKRGDGAGVRRLLRAGVGAGATDIYSIPAVLWAVAGGNADAIEALLAAGADVRSRGRPGPKALLYYMLQGNATPDFKVVQSLVKAGADVNAVDNSDTSVLVWAERNGDAKIIKLLESAGARRRYYGLPPR